MLVHRLRGFTPLIQCSSIFFPEVVSCGWWAADISMALDSNNRSILAKLVRLFPANILGHLVVRDGWARCTWSDTGLGEPSVLDRRPEADPLDSSQVVNFIDTLSQFLYPRHSRSDVFCYCPCSLLPHPLVLLTAATSLPCHKQTNLYCTPFSLNRSETKILTAAPDHLGWSKFSTNIYSGIQTRAGNLPNRQFTSDPKTIAISARTTTDFMTETIRNTLTSFKHCFLSSESKFGSSDKIWINPPLEAEFG